MNILKIAALGGFQNANIRCPLMRLSILTRDSNQARHAQRRDQERVLEVLVSEIIIGVQMTDRGMFQYS